MLAGESIYPGYNYGDHKFKNTDKPFELRARYNKEIFKKDSSDAIYNLLAELLVHEGVGHPFKGYHNWKNFPANASVVLSDPVYGADIQAQSDTGVTIEVLSSYTVGAAIKKPFVSSVSIMSIPFLNSSSKPENITSGTGFLNTEVSNPRTGSWSEQQRQVVRDALSASGPGYYDFVETDGSKVRVLRDADFKMVAAEQQRAPMRSLPRLLKILELQIPTLLRMFLTPIPSKVGIYLEAPSVGLLVLSLGR